MGINRIRNFTKRTREPFALPIVGRTFYVITDPKDVAAVYKAHTPLAFTNFLNEALKAFGVEKSSLNLAWHKPAEGDACWRDSNPVNPKQKHFVDWIKDVYRQQLLPGERMNVMVGRFRKYVDNRFRWNSISSFSLEPSEKKNAVHISLKDFCRKIMLEAMTDSLFGTCLTKVEPNLIKIVDEFNDDAWQLVHRYPKRFAKRVHANREKLLAAIDRYRKIPQEERTSGGEAWAVEQVMIEQEILGMSRQSNNAFLMLIHWAYV
jgi:hypothetical protein